MSQLASKARPRGEQRQEGPEAVVGRLMKNMYHWLRVAIGESLRREQVDLSFAHFMALRALASEPGVAGAELARRAFVTAQTMNTVLRRLEKEGLIERRPNPSNQRADSWSITKAGQPRMEKARVVAEGVWTRTFESLTQREVTELERLLQLCLTGLERQVSELRATKSSKAPARKKARK